MSGALLIAKREFVERRVVLWAALAAAVLPFMSPLLPGIPAGQGAEAREIMCLVLAAALGLGATLLIGASVVAKDLSDGRIGFDFSRPIGALSIWGGRFLGAFSVVAAAVAVVVVPTLIAHWIHPVAGAALSPRTLALTAAAVAGAIFCLLPLAHAASISLRSKSRWLALDLVATIGVALTVGLLVRSLVNAWALQIVSGLAVVLSAFAVFALWSASAVQVSVGRTDLRRGHRAQSLVLWSIAVVALLAAAGYVLWVLSAGPFDITHVDVTPAPNGDWVGVSGPGRGRFDYCPELLVNAKDGRVVPLAGASPWSSDLQFSDDGRRAVWIRRGQRDGGPSEVFTIDLGAAKPELRRSNVLVPSTFLMRPAVSPDGKRLAVLDGDILSIHDLDSGRVEGSVRLVRDTKFVGWPVARFTPAGTLRLYFFEPHTEVYEFDPAARALLKTGTGPEVDVYNLRAFAPDGERLIVRRAKTRETLVLDAGSLAVLATFSRPENGRSTVAILHDGRIVVGERDEAGARLRVCSRDGAEERVLPLSRGDLLFMVGEVAANQLLLTFGEQSASTPFAQTTLNSDSWSIDLTTGVMHEIAKRRIPAMVWGGTPVLPDPGSAAGHLFYTGDALVRIDSPLGAETVIAGRVGQP